MMKSVSRFLKPKKVSLQKEIRAELDKELADGGFESFLKVVLKWLLR